MDKSQHPLNLCRTRTILSLFTGCQKPFFCYVFDTSLQLVIYPSLGFNKRHKTTFTDFLWENTKISNCPWITPLTEKKAQVSFVSCPDMLFSDTSTSLVIPRGTKQVRAGISQNSLYLAIKRSVKSGLNKVRNIC